VVVVAERFSAEAWAAAAAAVGEDVAALVAFGCLGFAAEFGVDGVVHGIPHGYFFVQSLRKVRVRSGLLAPFWRFGARDATDGLLPTLRKMPRRMGHPDIAGAPDFPFFRG
jgi:hypothetical protein